MAEMPFPNDHTVRLEAIEILDICASSPRPLKIGVAAYYLPSRSQATLLACQAFKAAAACRFNLQETYAEAAQRLREGSYP